MPLLLLNSFFSAQESQRADVKVVYFFHLERVVFLLFHTKEIQCKKLCSNKYKKQIRRGEGERGYRKRRGQTSKWPDKGRAHGLVYTSTNIVSHLACCCRTTLSHTHMHRQPMHELQFSNSMRHPKWSWSGQKTRKENEDRSSDFKCDMLSTITTLVLYGGANRLTGINLQIGVSQHTERGREELEGRKSEKCCCSLSFVDSGANHIIRPHGLKQQTKDRVNTHRTGLSLTFNNSCWSSSLLCKSVHTPSAFHILCLPEVMKWSGTFKTSSIPQA